jgi:carbonic anhydrase
MTMPLPVAFDEKYRDRLVPLQTKADFPVSWQGTPIESFVSAINNGEKLNICDSPQLLIVTCIEFRFSLRIPPRFAYVIRRASGRLVGSEFVMAFTLAQGVKDVVLVGHNDCGMAKVAENAPNMVRALTEQGWNEERAEEFVRHHAARHAITDEIDALESEYHRLRRLFRHVRIAPLLACLSDLKLYLPTWYQEQQLGTDQSAEPQILKGTSDLTSMRGER